MNSSGPSTHETTLDSVAPVAGTVIYTCPMHPEVQMDNPCGCPKCGMALESKTASAKPGNEEESAELHDMSRRLWIGAILAVPVVVLAMAMARAGCNLRSPHLWCGGQVGHSSRAVGAQS
jgi:hypothetical protein